MNPIPETMTDRLRRAILDAIESGRASYKALGRDTGVDRASIMRFARGQRSLYLSVADKLALHFKLELRTREDA